MKVQSTGQIFKRQQHFSLNNSLIKDPNNKTLSSHTQSQHPRLLVQTQCQHRASLSVDEYKKWNNPSPHSELQGSCV